VVSEPRLSRHIGDGFWDSEATNSWFLPRSPATNENCLIYRDFRVSDGTRTRDRLDHNQELYLLSYAHREAFGM
jgi:hypothetical protein